MPKKVHTALHEVGIDTIRLKLSSSAIRLDKWHYATMHGANHVRQRRRTNRIMVPGAYPWCRLVLRVENDAVSDSSSVDITGSLPNFISGQNSWAPGDLNHLLEMALPDALHKLQKNALKPQDWSFRAVDISAAPIHEIHLFRCYHFRSKQELQRLLMHIFQLIAARRHGAMTRYRGTGLKWWPRIKGDVEYCLYDKFVEQKWHAACGRIPTGFKLKHPAPNTLKIEIKLYRKELRRLGLDTVGNWGRDTAARVYERYFGKLFNVASMRIPAPRISERQLRELPQKSRPYYMAAVLGIAPSLLGKPKTVRRHRALFERAGIAIDAKPRPPIPISKLLGRARTISRRHVPWVVRRPFQMLDEGI